MVSNNALSYGSYYWCVLRAKESSSHVMLWADELIVDASGALLCVGHLKDGSKQVQSAFAAGHWRAFYAASVVDGSPIAAELWNEEE
jgi:hypothetical protein